MTEQANRRNGQRHARVHTSLPAESPQVSQVWWGGGGASGRLWLTPCVTAALTTTLGWWGASPSLSFYKIPGSWSLNTERPFARGPGAAHTALSPLNACRLGQDRGSRRRPICPHPKRKITSRGARRSQTPKSWASSRAQASPRTSGLHPGTSPASKPSHEVLEQGWAPPPHHSGTVTAPRPTRAWDLEHIGPARPVGTYACICMSH